MKSYRIADVMLHIEENGQKLQPELDDFQMTLGEVEAARKVHIPEVRIAFANEKFDGEKESDDYQEKPIVTASMISIYESAQSFLVKYNAPAFIDCYVVEKESLNAVIYLKEPSCQDEVAEEGRNEMLYSIRDAFFFHIQKLGYIAVHSASIIYEEKAWLFSASSGTGKSTHVEMWKKAGFPIEMLNGDVAVCYVKDGMAYAAGLPWCGTSGIYTNRIVPLGGVLFLERSCHNAVNKLTLFESVLRLNARCVTPNWNQELMGHNLKTAQEVSGHIRAGVLYCRPEVEAAQVAKAFVDKI